MKTKDDEFNLMTSISKSLVSKLFIRSPDTYHKECYCKTKFLQSKFWDRVLVIWLPCMLLSIPFVYLINSWVAG